MIDGMTMDSTRTFRDVTHAADGAIDYSCDDNYRWSHATGFALINLFTLGRASAIAASARIGIKGAELTTALENMGREVRLGYQPQVVEVAPGKFVVDSYEALVRPVDASIHAGHVADWAAGHTGMAKSFLADSHAAVVADVADGVLPAASKVAVNVSRNVVRDPEGFLLIERGEKMYPQMSHELTESGGQLSEGTLQAAAPRMAADDLGTGKGPSTFLDTDKYSKYGVFDDGSDPWFGAGMYTWKYSKFEGNDLYRANGKVRSVTELQTVLKARGIRAGQDITMETYKWGISTTEKEMLAYRRMQKALSKSGLAGGKVKLQSVYWAKKAGVQGLDDLGLVIMGSFTFWV
jgi:hypothetical protein